MKAAAYTKARKKEAGAKNAAVWRQLSFRDHVRYVDYLDMIQNILFHLPVSNV